MSSPASVMVPEVGTSSPATIRSVVVLPHPDGPSSAKKEPAGTVRSSASTAANSPISLREAGQVEVGPRSLVSHRSPG